jgi:hypothetical protein
MATSRAEQRGQDLQLAVAVSLAALARQLWPAANRIRPQLAGGTWYVSLAAQDE